MNSTQFKWTRVAVSGVLNASNSGIGNISEDLIISGTSSRVVEYTYVLENAEGCVTDTGSFSVSITPGVIISVGDQSEVCNSPSNINIPLTDNFGDANFKWSRTLPSGIESIEYLDTYESGLRQTSIQETLINNTSNSIIVYYTLTADRNGACGVTKLIAQPVAPKLALLSSQEEIVCSDNALNYTIATNLPATYTWSRSLPTGVTASTGNLGSGNNINDVLVNCKDDLEFLEQRLLQEEKSKPQAERSEMGLIEKLKFVTDNQFERITYTEAIQILLDSPAYKKKKFKYDVSWGIDMQSEHERYLVEKHFTTEKQIQKLSQEELELNSKLEEASFDHQVLMELTTKIEKVRELKFLIEEEWMNTSAELEK